MPRDAIFRPDVWNLLDKGKCAISASMIQNTLQLQQRRKKEHTQKVLEENQKKPVFVTNHGKNA